MREDKTFCPICKKWNWVTDIIHLKDIADFSDDTFLGEINHPHNQVLGCGHCHAYFDWGTKQSTQNFNSYPAPTKIDWYEFRIKVFEVAKEEMKNLEYNDLGYEAFKLSIDFDEEIKNLIEKIKHTQTCLLYTSPSPRD